MSGRTAMTVSMSPSAAIRFRVSRSIRPCMSRTHIDVDRLPFGVMVEYLESQFTSQPAALHAAERRFEMHAAPAVDREIAGLHGARDAHRARDVARPDRSGESVHA